MARNRIIYASQSVWANGAVLYRVQSLGTTTTFTSEDIFELGHLDIIDVVDDVPAVAVTLNTNDFGDVKTLAILAQVPPVKAAMTATATPTTGNLISGTTYLHGVCLADFAVTCGNLPGVTIWAPVQAECDLGTLANNIDQTLFLDEVYVNSLEFGYSTGANATENFGAETDNKMWLLNDGAYVNYLKATVSGVDVTTNHYLDLVSMGYDIATVIPTLSTGNLAFLRKTRDGAPAVTWYDASANEMTNIEIAADPLIAAQIVNPLDPNYNKYVFNRTTARLFLPAGSAAPAAGDQVQVIFAADRYSEPMNTYFSPLTEGANADVGALRQGQVEVYIVDPDSAATDFEGAWRLTGVTISADLTRAPLTELGHLGPYDRPLNLPIPITLTVDSTAGDLENWAKFAGQVLNASLDDINLNDLMNKDNLCLVVKVFEQTDEEAGGTGGARRVLTDSLVGDVPMRNGSIDPIVTGATGLVPLGSYALRDKERALKTVVVKNLKITNEGMTLDLGSNATQTFGFKATNDLYVVKGDLSYDLVTGIMRNS